MPTSPKRPCRDPTCPVLDCQIHAREPWEHARPVARIRGRKLQQLRLSLWLKDPRCQSCGRVVAPHQMIRDHIKPLAVVGVDEPTNDNAQVLCKPCSEAKTKGEAQRGRGPGRQPSPGGYRKR
jgi:5-methylcytosine-specific restriction endonuclease McrA